MRFAVIEQDSDLQAWRARLATAPEAAPAGGPPPLGPQALAQLKALNPHLDFGRLDVGSVLLLPDAPELNAAGRPLGGEAFEGFAAQVAEGLKAVAQRLGREAQAQADERSEVARVLRTPALRRQIEGDALLGRQIDQAQAESERAQEQARQAAGQVEALQEHAAAELARLGKMFGLLN